MKKFYLLLSLVLTLLLVACSNGKANVTMTASILNTEEDVTRNSIKIQLIVNDLDKALEGTIRVVLHDESGLVKSNQTLETGTVENNVTFSGLLPNQTYYLTVSGTIAGASVTFISKQSFKTVVIKEYEITTIDEFLAIKSDTYGNYKLMKDLDFSNKTLTSSDYITAFRGTFDGNGKTIKNITFSKHSGYMGLFGQLSNNAVVKNLIVDRAVFDTTGEQQSIKTGSLHLGIVAAHVSQTGTLENITVKNSTIKLDIHSIYEQNVGIVAGKNTGKVDQIVVENSNIEVTIKRFENVFIGGAIGNVSADGSTATNMVVNTNILLTINPTEKLTYSETSGNLKAHNIYVGGAVGRFRDKEAKSLSNILVKSKIEINDENTLLPEINAEDKLKYIPYNVYVGGVVGLNHQAAIRDVLYNGEIKVSHHDAVETPAEGKQFSGLNKRFYVGGIVGRHNSSSRIYNAITIQANIAIISDASEQLSHASVSSFVGEIYHASINIRWIDLGSSASDLNGVVTESVTSIVAEETTIEELLKEIPFILENFKKYIEIVG